MTQEDKQLLLKDLSARLPYGVIVNFTLGDISFNERVSSVFVDERSVQVYVKQGFLKCPLDGDSEIKLSQVKPYLRPMSSMTVEEKKMVCSMNGLSDTELNDRIEYPNMYVQNYTIETFDLFNAHHLDYRGLIEKGLALEAPKDMYEKL
jgi:hypothetical protein